MTISLLGTAAIGTATTGTGVSATHTLSAGSNRIAIAFVTFYNPSSLVCSGVTYGGNAMTKIGETDTNSEKISAWYILEASLPADGSKTVTATISGTTYIAHIHVFTIQNAAQAVYEQSPTPGTYVSGSSNTSTINITTVVANAWVLTGAASNSGYSTGVSFTHGVGQTEITDHAQYGDLGTQLTMTTSYEEIASPGAISQTDIASGVADRMEGIGFSFAPLTILPSFFIMF